MKARNNEMGSNVTSAKKKKEAWQSRSAEDMRSEELSSAVGGGLPSPAYSPTTLQYSRNTMTIQ